MNRPPLPLVVAHRGASLTHPENTLPAIAAACDVGADVIELDVRLSRDHVPVLMHDRSLARTTGRDGTVDSLSAAELRTLDAGAWRGKRFHGTPPPLLADAIASLRKREVSLCLELKDFENHPPDAAVSAVSALLALEELSGRAVFNVPTPGAVQALKAHRPALRVAVDSAPTLSPPDIAACGADIVEYEHRQVTPEIVRACRRLGIGVWAWTANEPADWRRLVAAGVDAVLTDDPAGLLAFLGR